MSVNFSTYGDDCVWRISSVAILIITFLSINGFNDGFNILQPANSTISLLGTKNAS